MPKIRLDAVAVATTNMSRAIEFYTCLGFDFPDNIADQPHVEPITAPGDIRLMIDTAELMETLIGAPPKPSNHSHFAMLCDTPADVDLVAKQIADAGFEIRKSPWDAFWGQRYAIVADPDGYQIDLFANQ